MTAEPWLSARSCNGPMRVVALIDDDAVIRRILEHLGRWALRQKQRAPPQRSNGAKGLKQTVQELTYHP